MRQCPKCSHVDPAYWHPRIFDYEIDICRFEDLANDQGLLASRVRQHKQGETHIEGEYAYKITKSNVVYRMWMPLFKARGWSPKGQYYDGITSPGSAAYKKAVSTLASMRGSLEKYFENYG